MKQEVANQLTLVERTTDDFLSAASTQEVPQRWHTVAHVLPLWHCVNTLLIAPHQQTAKTAFIEVVINLIKFM